MKLNWTLMDGVYVEDNRRFQILPRGGSWVCYDADLNVASELCDSVEAAGDWAQSRLDFPPFDGATPLVNAVAGRKESVPTGL